jgi:hypothetical protein
MDISPQSSRSKNKQSNKPREVVGKLKFVGFLFGLLFDPEDGDEMFLRNVGMSSDYMVLHPRRLYLITAVITSKSDNIRNYLLYSWVRCCVIC